MTSEKRLKEIKKLWDQGYTDYEDVKWLINQVKKLTEMLDEANDLCRSAYQIADRKGSGTNWKAFIEQLSISLKRQRKVLEEHDPR